MAITLPHRVLVDSGFWFALFDARDTHHQDAVDKENLLESAAVIVPWPTLYEAVNSRFVKNRRAVQDFERILKARNVTLVDDCPYREHAFEETVRTAAAHRTVALVDMVIRFMLDDGSLRVNWLLTYDVPDFADVCRKRSIQIV